jgi:type IV pilus assembly protein PilF
MFRSLIIVSLILLLAACAGGGAKGPDEETKFADTHVRLGLGYLQQGRLEEALDRLQKALDAAPDYPEAHSSIALVYERLGEPDNAARHFERALKLKPQDGPTLNNYAVFLCGQGQPLEAEKYFLQAIKSRNYPTPAAAYENLGVCALKIPDLDKAETYLRNALQLEPRLPVALLQMARVSLEKTRYLSGRAYLQRFQEVAAMNPEALWLGIQIEKKLGDRDALQTYAAQLRKRFPDANETRLLLESGIDKP